MFTPGTNVTNILPRFTNTSQEHGYIIDGRISILVWNVQSGAPMWSESAVWYTYPKAQLVHQGERARRARTEQRREARETVARFFLCMIARARAREMTATKKQKNRLHRMRQKKEKTYELIDQFWPKNPSAGAISGKTWPCSMPRWVDSPTTPPQQGTPSLTPPRPLIPRHSFGKKIRKMRDRNHFFGNRKVERSLRPRGAAVLISSRELLEQVSYFSPALLPEQRLAAGAGFRLTRRSSSLDNSPLDVDSLVTRPKQNTYLILGMGSLDPPPSCRHPAQFFPHLPDGAGFRICSCGAGLRTGVRKTAWSTDVLELIAAGAGFRTDVLDAFADFPRSGHIRLRPPPKPLNTATHSSTNDWTIWAAGLMSLIPPHACPARLFAASRTCTSFLLSEPIAAYAGMVPKDFLDVCRRSAIV